MSALCSAKSCTPIPGRHVPDCQAEACTGCLPHRVEGQLTVCHRCRENLEGRLEGLSGLYRDLLRPTRAGSPVRRSEGTERPTALSAGALEARSAIRRELIRWSAHHVGLIGAPPNLSNIATECRYVRALTWRYLSTDLGGQLTDGIDYVWHIGQRAAYPALPLGYVIGECTVIVDDESMECRGKVRALIDAIDGEGYATCQQCNTTAPIAWWRDHLPTVHPEWLGMTDLRWHLVVMVGVRVPVGTIHTWAHRGKLPTQVGGRGGGRATYHVDTALALARKAAHRLAKAGMGSAVGGYGVGSE